MLRSEIHLARTLLNNLRRNNATQHLPTAEHFSTDYAAALTSDSNRSRCMKCMQKTPMLRMQNHNPDAASAAVFIGLCMPSPHNEQLSILFTRRSSKLSRHRSQISFPGGLRDSTDADFIDCALRETEEEIGLHRSQVEIWGSGAMIKPPHTAAIMPVIGLVHNFNAKELKINADEVDEVYAIAVKELALPSTLHYTQFKSGYSSPVFVIDKYRIWGITGYMTHVFLNCLIESRAEAVKDVIRFLRPVKSR